MTRARGRRRDTPGHARALYKSGASGNAGRACGIPGYPSRRVALGHSRAKGWTDAYACEVCGKWHPGKPPR